LPAGSWIPIGAVTCETAAAARRSIRSSTRPVGPATAGVASTIDARSPHAGIQAVCIVRSPTPASRGQQERGSIQHYERPTAASAAPDTAPTTPALLSDKEIENVTDHQVEVPAHFRAQSPRTRRAGASTGALGNDAVRAGLRDLVLLLAIDAGIRDDYTGKCWKTEGKYTEETKHLSRAPEHPIKASLASSNHNKPQPFPVSHCLDV
jgi:hypothetical protein